MRQSWFKTLIPSRAILIGLLLCALLILLYSQHIAYRSSHLEKRNFRQLSEIGFNLESNIVAAERNLHYSLSNFNDCNNDKSTNDKSTNDKSTNDKSTNDKSTSDKFKEKLIRDSQFFDRDDQIRFLSTKIPPDVSQFEGIDTVIRSGRITFKITDPCPKEVAGKEVAVKEDKFRQVEFDLSLAEFVEINLPRHNFSQILIANESGEILHGNNGNSVLLDGNDLEQLLGTPDTHLQFLSSEEWTNRTGHRSLKSSSKAENSSSTVKSSEDHKGSSEPNHKNAGGSIHHQSKIMRTRVGSSEYLLFLQPYTLTRDIQTSSTGLRRVFIVGVIEKATYRANRLSIPLDVAGALFLLVILLLLSFNLFRVVFIDSRGVVRLIDVERSVICFLLIISLGVVSLHDLSLRYFIASVWKEDIKKTANVMSKQFDINIEQKLKAMKEGMKLPLNDQEVDVLKKYIKDAKYICDPFIKSDGSKKWHCTENQKIANIYSLFFLNKSGRQLPTYFDYHGIFPTAKDYNLSMRSYYERANSGKLWRFRPEIFSSAEDTSYPNFYLDRIESISDLRKKSVISMRYVSADGPAGLDGKENQPQVIVSTFSLSAFEGTILPPGFGFAVIEDKTGKVMYHSDDKRSLRENIFSSTDHDPDLKMAVLTHTQRHIDMDYSGESIYSWTRPLNSVPWTLLVYYEKDLMSSYIFQSTLTAALLFLSYFVLLLILFYFFPKLYFYLRRIWNTERDEFIINYPWAFPSLEYCRSYAIFAIILCVASGFYAAIIATNYLADNSYPKGPILLRNLSLVLIIGPLIVSVGAIFIALILERVDAKYTLRRKLQSHSALLSSKKARRQHDCRFSFELCVYLLALVLVVFPAIVITTNTNNLYRPVLERLYTWHFSKSFEARIDSLLRRSRGSDLESSVMVDSELLINNAYDFVEGIYFTCQEYLGKDIPFAKQLLNTKCTRPSEFPVLHWRQLDAESASDETDDSGPTGFLYAPLINRLSETYSFIKAFSGEHRKRCKQEEDCLSEDQMKKFQEANKSSSEKGARQVNIFPHEMSSKLLYFSKPMAGGLGESNWLHLFLLLIMIPVLPVVRYFTGRLTYLTLNERLREIKAIGDLDWNFGYCFVVPPGWSWQKYWKIISRTGLESDHTGVKVRFSDAIARYYSERSGSPVFRVAEWSELVHDDSADRMLGVLEKCVAEGGVIAILSVVDPFHWLKGAEARAVLDGEQRARWLALLEDTKTIDFRSMGVDASPSVMPSEWRRRYKRSTLDERIVLAGLAWDGYFNPMNQSAALSLVYRGLIDKDKGRFCIPDNNLRKLVRKEFSYASFTAHRFFYEEGQWRKLKVPFIVFAIGALFFLAYAAESQLKSLLSALSIFAATLAAVRGAAGLLKAGQADEPKVVDS